MNTRRLLPLVALTTCVCLGMLALLYGYAQAVTR